MSVRNTESVGLQIHVYMVTLGDLMTQSRQATCNVQSELQIITYTIYMIYIQWKMLCKTIRFINSFSAGTDFRRQNLTPMICCMVSEISLALAYKVSSYPPCP